MIDSIKLFAALEHKKTSLTTMVKRLEDDLRKHCDAQYIRLNEGSWPTNTGQKNR